MALRSPVTMKMVMENGHNKSVMHHCRFCLFPRSGFPAAGR